VSVERYFRVRAAGITSWARQDGDKLRLLEGEPWTALRERGPTVSLSEVALLPPSAPSKIIGVGRNYADHAAERGKAVPREPLLFLKPPSALIGPGEPIRCPAWAGRVEAARLRGPEDALAHVFGATCVNDVTAREIQEKDVQFTRAKGFDTFCPMGPCVATGLAVDRLRLVGRVNGEIRQEASTEAMVFSVAHLIWYVSQVMTLRPGDIISTGTPSGVGPLRPGDVAEVEIHGVGTLENPVVKD
jgi:2-keto-4-pentenoate hydratase/2-oxohepta-3-ene-1,7-dioic acid hydratase in catechol pathway